MKRLLATAMAVAALAFANAATGQTLLPTEQVQRSTANLQRALSANDRMTSITNNLLNDPALRNPTSMERFQATIEARLPQVEIARAELRQIEAELRAIPPVAPPGGAPELRSTDMTVASVADQAQRLEALYAKLPEIAVALRARDMDRALPLLTSLGEGSVATLDAQAISMRGSVAFVDQSEPAYFQAMGSACMNDGIAAYFRVILNLQTPAEGASAIEAAIACSERYVRGGHLAASEMIDVLATRGDVAQLRIAMGQTWKRMFVEMDQIPVLLGEVRSDIVAGRIDATKRSHDARFQTVRIRMDALVGEQAEIMRISAGG